MAMNGFFRRQFKPAVKILLFTLVAGACGFAGSKMELWSNRADAAAPALPNLSTFPSQPVRATGTVPTPVTAPVAVTAHQPAPAPQAVPQPLPANEMRNVVIPQVVNRNGTSVQVRSVEAGVVINDQMAMTTLDIELFNPSPRPQEAELVLPVPEGAVIKAFSFEGAAPEATAQLIQKDEASRTYHEIVSRLRDPALMEFAGLNLIRTSVFPLAANGGQKVRLSYEHMLPAEGDRVDYFLPRSDSVDYQVPWRINVRIKSRKPVSSLYSPTHEIDTVRASENIMSARIKDTASRTPGAFRLSYVADRGGITATFFAYPDEKIDGGYFMMLAAPPVRAQTDARQLPRDVTLVIDCSGSMMTEKLNQARDAAIKIIEGMRAGESFNVIAFGDSSQILRTEPLAVTPDNVAAARTFIRGLILMGGTNIYEALGRALNPRPADDRVPIVLFLTDGQPTVGPGEADIRKLVQDSNPYRCRIFSIGVGKDVNAPLLDAMAGSTRGFSTYVPEGANVETQVAAVSMRLDRPLFAAPKLTVVDDDGDDLSSTISETLPRQLPDLYVGDQIIVLGKYRGHQSRTFTLTGGFNGHRGTFKFAFDPKKASATNAFVSRLWASRKIGGLVDEIRDQGADPKNLNSISDPRLKELADQVVALSREFGILTEYTAFLSLEGTDLSNRDAVLAQAMTNFQQNAVNIRTGQGAISQSANVNAMNGQFSQNIGNRYIDQNMNAVSNVDVQQVNDLAFFRRNGRWVDSRLAAVRDPAAGARTVDFGTPEYDRLSNDLSARQRQGLFMLRGEVVTEVDGQRVLIRMPTGN